MKIAPQHDNSVRAAQAFARRAAEDGRTEGLEAAYLGHSFLKEAVRLLCAGVEDAMAETMADNVYALILASSQYKAQGGADLLAAALHADNAELEPTIRQAFEEATSPSPKPRIVTRLITPPPASPSKS